MIKIFSHLLPLCFIVFLPGCSPVSVNYDYDQSVNFATIQTYTWGEIPGVDDILTQDPLLKKRFVASIDNYLQSRGYRMVAPDQADVLVVIQAGVNEKMQIIDWGYPGGYYGRPYGWHGGYGYGSPFGSRIDVSYYEEGTLIVDIVENAKKQLIWRGLGKGIVQRYADHAKLQAAVDKYVFEILNHFPPGNEKISR